MQSVFPLEETVIKSYIGRNLYAVTHEEMEAFGKLSRVDDGVLYFNESSPAATVRKRRGKSAAANAFAKKRNNSRLYLRGALGETPGDSGSAFYLELPRIAYLFAEDN